MTTTATQPNRLIHETSPYLLQHAHNPVDWYPWGPEALARAAAEDKPILLSVGYSACHWCHVMAHESFEDPDTAALMNELFVNVKVDREERPDIDAIYMEAVQAMTGRGGWPMTVFLAPDGRPFYGGTYYPPEPRYGMPSFRQLLRAIAEAWQERRREMESSGDRMADVLNRSAALRPADTVLGTQVLDKAAQNLMRSLDPYEGGFSDAPKFPQPMNLDFLLQNWRRTGDEKQRKAVTYTLAKMARGGIYDQLGGGFHRYSTDAHWLVPHFEKMLYDNAQLARTYLHAWQITGEAELRRIVEETLDYVLREMTARSGGLAEGGFYSTQDADSEGVEGKFFVWTPDEVLALLGPNDGPLFSAYFDVTARGNFHEGGHSTNILHAENDLEDAAEKLKVSEEQLAGVIARGREILFVARERRVHPGRDEKILAEWNGLMIHALAEAGAVLGRADYVQAAVRGAEFVLTRMARSQESGVGGQEPGLRPSSFVLRLFRTYNAGRAHLNAYLEDYAAVALGFVALYQATFELRWLEAAAALAQTILVEFRDADGAGFFQVSADHEKLVVRRKDFIDSAIPSGNSLTAELFLKLAVLLGDDAAGYLRHAEGILRLMADGMGEQPLAFGRLLCALDLYLNPGQEIAIIGDPAAGDTRALLAEVRRRYLPNSVLALAAPGDTAAAELIPLLAERGAIDGRAAAYVCRDFVCSLPVTEPEALAAQLT
jgi:hypothetical protein